MAVRGAPLIGGTAAYGIVLAIQENKNLDFIKKSSEELVNSRPTAINLQWAIHRMNNKLSFVKSDELLNVARKYTETLNRWLTFEYVLLKEINDSVEDAKRLLSMLAGMKKCKLNIIPYNETDGEFRRPDKDQIENFVIALRPAKFPITVRWSKGTDIDAGCGQLATRNQA